MEWIRWGVLIGLLSSAMVVALATFFITGVSVIDPSTVMQICDGIDDAGRMLGSIAVALLVATAVIVTAALFLGLAIRAAGRAIIRRFAERRI